MTVAVKSDSMINNNGFLFRPLGDQLVVSLDLRCEIEGLAVKILIPTEESPSFGHKIGGLVRRLSMFHGLLVRRCAVTVGVEGHLMGNDIPLGDQFVVSLDLRCEIERLAVKILIPTEEGPSFGHKIGGFVRRLAVFHGLLIRRCAVTVGVESHLIADFFISSHIGRVAFNALSDLRLPTDKAPSFVGVHLRLGTFCCDSRRPFFDVLIHNAFFTVV